MRADHPFLAPIDAPVVLASRSPRRAEILRTQGIEFVTVEPAIDERLGEDEDPVEHVRRLGLEKARVVAQARPRAVVLAGDTVVVLEGRVLGKPADAAQARAMLHRLAGRTHRVHSSVAVAHRASGHEWVDHQTTAVRFRPLGDAEIARYVDSGEPMDKAGAYGIQALGALLVESIEGEYFNVMGWPLQAFRRGWNALAARLRE